MQEGTVPGIQLGWTAGSSESQAEQKHPGEQKGEILLPLSLRTNADHGKDSPCFGLWRLQWEGAKS